MALLGHQIGKELVEALGLPRCTVGFTLRCWAGELVTVECECLPDDSFVPVLARYELLRLKDEPQAEPVVVDFDTWYRERRERAHREFMDSTRLHRIDRAIAAA